MSSTNKTPNYDLPQWVETDEFKREDFNQAFADIDTNLNLVQLHLSEPVYQTIYLTRDISIAGLQTINTNFKPKMIDIIAYVGNTIYSVGKWSESGGQFSFAKNSNNINAGTESTAITFEQVGSWFGTGTIVNITNTSFDINWVKSIGSPSGTAKLKILVAGH